MAYETTIVTGFTADRMLEIENSTVVDGEVVGDNLILKTRDDQTINAGNVRGAPGDKGDPGAGNVDTVNGKTGPDVVLDPSDVGAPAIGDPNHFLPPGTIVDFAGASAPVGWLLCHGQTLNETEYPELYAAIGNLWGHGGAGTFNIPDTRGRVTVAVAHPQSSSLFKTFAQTLGEPMHYLTKAQLPNLETESAGSHTHEAPDSGYRIVTTNRDEFAKRSGTSWSSGAWVPALTDSINNVFTLTNAGAHTHVVNSGGGQAFSIVQPSIVMHKIIKT